jgi:opacity protein-like surface antigen
MPYTTRLLLSVAFAAVSLPAVAADYAPPIFVEEAAPWVPVEIGSGWYLRGDVSYNLGDLIYDLDNDDDFELSRVGGSVGFGHHFNDLFRSDLTVSYLGGDSVGIPLGEASYSMWNGMANAYVDLGTVMGITPYVGAGAGLTYSRQEIETTAPFSYANRQYNFSYALLAGVSYRATNNVSVDLGYQFLNTPGLDYLDAAGTVREGHKQHLVKVGLRYDLW